MTTRAAQLVEQGIRAYTRGQLDDAERYWKEALAADPRDERARSYLDLLVEHVADDPVVSLPLPKPRRAATHADGDPAPAWLRPPVARDGDADPFAGAAVPLPAPAGWERPTGPAAEPWDQGPALGASVVLSEGEGLDFASVADQTELRPLVPEPPRSRSASGPPGRAPRSEVEIWMQGARELFALGDFSGSLEMIEKILRRDPSHAEAREYLKQNESTLIAMYESKLGPRDAIPRLAIKPEEVMWLNLDHRAGFLLAQIDGTVDYESLFALSGLPRLDTARILATLIGDGVITS